MRCRKVKRRLLAFLDGDTGEKEKERIARHLKTCPSCKEETEVVSSLWGLLEAGKESIKPSPYFWNKLERRITQTEANKNAFDTIFKWLNRTLVPACTTAVIIIGLFIGIHLGGVIYTGIAQILNSDDSSLVQQDMIQALNLNTLNDFPQESIGDIYTGLLAEGNSSE